MVLSCYQYVDNIRFNTGWNASLATRMPRRLRLRLRVLQEFKWDLPPVVRITLPVADILNRLVTARLVFCFGMVLSWLAQPGLLLIDSIETPTRQAVSHNGLTSRFDCHSPHAGI